MPNLLGRCVLRQFYQLRAGLFVRFQAKRGDKEGGHRGWIRLALAIFDHRDLAGAIANGNAQFGLGEASATT